MKKTFTFPKLTVYGNANQLTQAIGSQPVTDTLIVNGKIISNTDGSADFTG